MKLQRIALETRMRWPHVERLNSKQMDCWRVYGFRWHFRFCIFDWTRTRFFASREPYWRIRLFGLTVIERNREFSGFPH